MSMMASDEPPSQERSLTSSSLFLAVMSGSVDTVRVSVSYCLRFISRL